MSEPIVSFDEKAIKNELRELMSAVPQKSTLEVADIIPYRTY